MPRNLIFSVCHAFVPQLRFRVHAYVSSITPFRTITKMAQNNNKSKHIPEEATLRELQDVATRIRIESVRMTTACKSGHPSSSASMADIAAVLFFHTMHHDPNQPRNPNNDRFVLSKGHAAPALYAVWAQLGYLKHEDLLTLRKFDSNIEGHPTPRLDFVDVASGSLGQGLGVAAGMAYLGKYIEKAPYRTFCVIGDGESAEGSIWEAMNFAGIYKLNNLVAIIDVNRLGQSQPTPFGHQMDVYKKRAEAFGWDAAVVDGHNIKELCEALGRARDGAGDKPFAILAKTFKGHGIPEIENEDNWHGKPLAKDKAELAIETMTGRLASRDSVGKPSSLRPPSVEDQTLQAVNSFSRISIEKPSYDKKKEIATRAAYGTALVKLASACDKIVALDGDVKNSTFSQKLLEIYPQRFVECFIAEQNMLSVALGMSCRKRCIPFVSTFGAFYTRAADQIRMAAISFGNIKCVGSHVGVSIGEDGTSQMALEDLALFRSLPKSVVFYPSDAVATERACELAANYNGICYIRTGRPTTPIQYEGDEKFEIGQAKVVRACDGGAAVLIGAGVTFFEALKAADQLEKENIKVAVIDPFTVKPIDAKTIAKVALANGGLVIVSEDHYPEGGLGEAVASCMAELADKIRVVRLAVMEVPRSGQPDELIDKYNIGARSIVEAVKKHASAKK